MRRPDHRDETGQVTVLIIGLATVLAMTIAVVVDTSAAYLQRQGLDTIADGAALSAADLGATGEETYLHGVPRERLELDAVRAREAVAEYLVAVDAQRSYPGLSWAVTVDAATATVTVRLRAPLELPLTVPGAARQPTIGARGSAVVSPS